jgi:hypothetical protein
VDTAGVTCADPFGSRRALDRAVRALQSQRDMKLISFASLIALTACSGSSTDHATRLRDATQPQLVRTIVAAEAGDLAFAGFTAFVSTLDGSCPLVTTTGNNTDVAGGCTSNGAVFSGSAQFVDAQALFSASGSGTTTLTYDDFAESGSAVIEGVDGQAVDGYELDGTVAFDAAAGSTTGFTATLFGIAVTTVMDSTCTATTCTLGDGATIDVTGLGAFDVAGAWAKDQSSGSVVVTGADTLTVDFAGSGCVTYQVSDGGSGQLCNGSGS